MFERNSFVGSKERQQQEGNGEKEAAVKGSGPCELVLREFQKAEESGRMEGAVRLTATVLVSFKLPSKDKFTQQAVK